jgi:superfamily II DNA/RNA helicase
MLDNPKMKADFWSLYEKTPEKKQSLMFSATITSESLRNMRDMIRENCAEIKI